ncbi:hypothetical protein QAD02_008292 [Eretmocerus hayati]|uniref:Uncharacterized protein n=1 Tax=Eretmocerus hayati TaxID=131215 RepID=A0ACC2NAF8_9HYME|nr:hypothetical protein QAD02_008292 [Eretmocerus hayati]
MGEDITDELEEICGTERKSGKNLQRKLKIVIGSSNPSLDFTLSDSSQLEPKTTEDDTTMHDCTITDGGELDNTVPPSHIPAVSHIATPPVHQKNENVERYLHILPNGLLRNHTNYFTAIPVLPVIDPNRPTFRNYQVCRIIREIHDEQDTDIHVDWNDYHTMKPESWESGRIIDAVLAILPEKLAECHVHQYRSHCITFWRIGSSSKGKPLASLPYTIPGDRENFFPISQKWEPLGPFHH